MEAQHRCHLDGREAAGGGGRADPRPCPWMSESSGNPGPALMPCSAFSCGNRVRTVAPWECWGITEVTLRRAQHYPSLWGGVLRVPATVLL